MKILCIDPGEKNIGVALSDPTGSIANPLTVIKHKSRAIDAASLCQIAVENNVGLIVVGQAIDNEGIPTYSGRKAVRLAASIRKHTEIPVTLWDESHSTKAAQKSRIKLGVSRKKRSGHMDDLAAAVILQSFLDDQYNSD